MSVCSAAGKSVTNSDTAAKLAAMQTQFDHLVIAAHSLDQGQQFAEATLGVKLPAGGQHPQMGTHNLLTRLEDGAFLEIIAIDPSLPAPQHKRWFDLDDKVLQARLAKQPELVAWVARTDAMAGCMRVLGADWGTPVTASRGGLSWLFAVRPDGKRPEQGAAPCLIEWPPGPHASTRMGDVGIRLKAFSIEHPWADPIGKSLDAIGWQRDPRISIRTGAYPRLTCVLATPASEVTLQSHLA